MAYCPSLHCVAALLVLLLVLCAGGALAQSTADKAATLTFLRRLAASVPTLQSDWTGDDYSVWKGVTVDAEGYVSIRLPSANLHGTLPVIEDDDVPRGTRILVTALDLSGNAGLTGMMRDSWAKLSALRTLDLSYTGLSGIIPDSWSGMTSLRTVNLSNINSCGGLPHWRMPLLVSADLSNSGLRGTLSASWVDMVSLQTLTVTGNSFCGCEPVPWLQTPVLHNAVAGMPAANLQTCSYANWCTGTSYYCGPSSSSSTSTTTSTTTTTTAEPTVLPSTTTTTRRPASARAHSVALALAGVAAAVLAAAVA